MSADKPGMKLKQRVKAGELTREEAIAILASLPGGNQSATMKWLQKGVQ